MAKRLLTRKNIPTKSIASVRLIYVQSSHKQTLQKLCLDLCFAQHPI